MHLLVHAKRVEGLLGSAFLSVQGSEVTPVFQLDAATWTLGVQAGWDSVLVKVQDKQLGTTAIVFAVRTSEKQRPAAALWRAKTGKNPLFSLYVSQQPGHLVSRLAEVQ